MEVALASGCWIQFPLLYLHTLCHLAYWYYFLCPKFRWLTLQQSLRPLIRVLGRNHSSVHVSLNIHIRNMSEVSTEWRQAIWCLNVNFRPCVMAWTLYSDIDCRHSRLTSAPAFKLKRALSLIASTFNNNIAYLEAIFLTYIYVCVGVLYFRILHQKYAKNATQMQSCFDANQRISSGVRK